MTSPTIRLVTDDDMRSITSQTLELIKLLPHLYTATDAPDVMRSWGAARGDGAGSVATIVHELLKPVLLNLLPVGCRHRMAT